MAESNHFMLSFLFSLPFTSLCFISFFHPPMIRSFISKWESESEHERERNEILVSGHSTVLRAQISRRIVIDLLQKYIYHVGHRRSSESWQKGSGFLDGRISQTQ
jgi:hypothetical protein